jgi:hypothetical protein
MRKRTKRTVRPLNRDPIGYVLESVRPPKPQFVDKLRMQELGAIEAFVTGRGDLEQWQVLARMVNTSEYLGAQAGCGPEAVPVARKAADGLMACVARHEETQAWSLDGPTLGQLREVRSFMDLQFQSLTVGELDRHFAAIAREQERLRRQA